ncbi:MAG TPA: chemotaxis protein CheB, partial [Burkholderiaceae bacterium]|nr:chemotaxis protein CheB [Burkholderiaceae bacterium]
MTQARAGPPGAAVHKLHIVAVGASVGGVEALTRLASRLPGDFPGVILVVLHVGAYPSMLPSLLSEAGPLPAVHASDGQPLEPGRIYIAPPDHHLLVDGEYARLSRGPKEHHTRPAADTLFRSVALACGPRVVGVVLTGQLDDGTAGLQAIKACGGLSIVQDPREAPAPSMPLSALEYVDVDHCLPIDAIAAMMVTLAHEPAPAAAPPPPRELEREHELTTTGQIAMDEIEEIGQPSKLSCPDCGGVLWSIKDSQPPRYRCHTGHGFTQRSLGNAMDDTVD